jgi:nucleoside 2-deoxyribosyltransferase
VVSLENVIGSEEVFRRDIDWINGCDALVAEVSTPSHGVGYEIGQALNIGKPVLCCYRKGVKVSKMITGNTMSGLELKVYTTRDEVKQIVRKYLQALAEQGG